MSNTVEVPEELYHLMLSQDAPGTWPRGTRVRKLTREAGDKHGPGALGTIHGTMGPIKSPSEAGPVAAYLVIWDDMPGVLVFVHDAGGKRLEAVQRTQ